MSIYEKKPTFTKRAESSKASKRICSEENARTCKELLLAAVEEGTGKGIDPAYLWRLWQRHSFPRPGHHSGRDFQRSTRHTRGFHS